MLITNVVSRTTFSQMKPPSNGKPQSLTNRPIIAPLTIKNMTNAQLDRKNLVQPKPTLSTVRRSSLSPTVTSSASSTNTEESISCILASTKVLMNSNKIIRSTSNDNISSTLNISTKSRIPVRSIPISIIKY